MKFSVVLISAASGPFGPWVARKKPNTEEVELFPRRRLRKKLADACPCKIFKLCDQYYKLMPDDLRAVWRAAVKRKGISGYDLWMHEAMWLMNRGFFGPDAPSPSGGFTNRLARPGCNYPPPPCVKLKRHQRPAGHVHMIHGPPDPFTSYIRYEHRLKHFADPAGFMVHLHLQAYWHRVRNEYLLDVDGYVENNFFKITPDKFPPNDPDITYAGRARIRHANMDHAWHLDDGVRYELEFPIQTEQTPRLVAAMPVIDYENKPTNWSPQNAPCHGTISWHVVNVLSSDKGTYFIISVDAACTNTETGAPACGHLFARGLVDKITRHRTLAGHWPMPPDGKIITNTEPCINVFRNMAVDISYAGNYIHARLDENELFEFSTEPDAL